MFNIRILLLGDTHVGKTKLCRVYTKKCWDGTETHTTPTIGVDNISIRKYYKEKDLSVVYSVWDTAGQERFSSIVRSFYRDAHACILAFDLTSSKSFNKIEFWYNELHKYCTNIYGTETNQPFPIVLVGTKNDLKEYRKVNEKSAKKLCKKLNIPFYFESGKNDVSGVEHIIDHMVTKCYQKYIQHKDLNSCKKQVRLWTVEKEKEDCCIGYKFG